MTAPTKESDTAGVHRKFLLAREKALLLIVDIQERLAAVMSQREKVVTNTLHLIEAARLLGVPIVITEQYPKGLGQTVTEVREALRDCRAVEKLHFSCCREPSFREALSAFGKQTIVLVGMETHVCVLQTCIDLLEEGYRVHVPGDAVCSRTKENYRAGIEFMRDAGASITCTETVLFQLLEQAGTEEFRSIVKRIK